MKITLWGHEFVPTKEDKYTLGCVCGLKTPADVSNKYLQEKLIKRLGANRYCGKKLNSFVSELQADIL